MITGKRTLAARITPSFIAAAPLMYLVWQVLGTYGITAVPRLTIVCALGVLLMHYLNELFVYLEESYHERLVKQWGGTATDLLLRHDSGGCDDMTRTLLYRRIKTDFGICLLPECESLRNPRQAQMLINAAVSRIMRSSTPAKSRLLVKHQKDFGMISGIAAGVNVLFAFSAGLLVGSVYSVMLGGFALGIALVALSVEVAVLAVFLRKHYMPKLLKKKAFMLANTLYHDYLHGHC